MEKKRVQPKLSVTAPNEYEKIRQDAFMLFGHGRGDCNALARYAQYNRIDNKSPLRQATSHEVA